MKLDLDKLVRASGGAIPEDRIAAMRRKEPGYVEEGRIVVPQRKVQRFGGVMLAHKWQGEDPRGWLMSEKLDGMRAYWTGSHLVTRNNNTIHAPGWFLALLPKGIPLDGELWLDRGYDNFRELVSITRRGVPDDEQWRRVRYLVFAAPAERTVEDEQAAIVEVVRSCEVGRRSCPIQMVEQTRCKGPEHLKETHARLVKLGAEGVMLRAPGSPYERTRSHQLLKVKGVEQAEARIVGYIPGKGKYTGMLGGYEIEMLDSGVRTEVGTGLTDEHRAHPLKRGSIITIQFQELSREGRPRFPVYVPPSKARENTFVAARDYE